MWWADGGAAGDAGLVLSGVVHDTLSVASGRRAGGACPCALRESCPCRRKITISQPTPSRAAWLVTVGTVLLRVKASYRRSSSAAMHAQARHPEREHRASCVQTRPCNRIGRQFCACNRAAKSDETRGREDFAQGICTPHPAITARRDGEHWQAPIITLNQYVTKDSY